MRGCSRYGVIASAFSNTYPGGFFEKQINGGREEGLPVKAISGKHRRSREWGWMLLRVVDRVYFVRVAYDLHM